MSTMVPFRVDLMCAAWDHFRRSVLSTGCATKVNKSSPGIYRRIAYSAATCNEAYTA